MVFNLMLWIDSASFLSLESLRVWDNSRAVVLLPQCFFLLLNSYRSAFDKQQYYVVFRNHQYLTNWLKWWNCCPWLLSEWGPVCSTSRKPQQKVAIIVLVFFHAPELLQTHIVADSDFVQCNKGTLHYIIFPPVPWTRSSKVAAPQSFLCCNRRKRENPWR